ncbi:MAG TPA: ribonuclease Z [Anaerolineae bacterium]|nr:ribonuclease Z [Anaerolineae bacterium]
MFEIVFLGTSAAAPSIRRSLSAHVVLHNEYRFLIDCGEGTQRQLLKSGLGFKRLNKILLTHGHLDHILGLGGLLSTFMRWEVIDRVEVYGGRSALDRVEDLIYRVVLRGARPAAQLAFIDVKPGALLADETFELSAFPVSHRGGDCYGYLFREKSRRPFLVERAEALGVPPGPERRRLVAGETVTLADGRRIHPDAVLGPEIRGAVLAHVGDTGRTSDLLESVRGADALVIEATYLESEADLARAYDHLTAAQAARLARDAQVGQLILTHISRRYGHKQVLAEAQAIFPNTAVARDFDRYRILKEKSILLAEPIIEEENWDVAA